MANQDLRLGGAGMVNAPKPAYDVLLDFEKNPRAQGEKVILFDAWDGLWIERILLKVERAEGGAATVDVGDYTSAGVEVDADGWVDGADANAVALVFDSDEAYLTANVAGKYYTADNYIAMLCNNAMDYARIRVMVFARDCAGEEWLS